MVAFHSLAYFRTFLRIKIRPTVPLQIPACSGVVNSACILLMRIVLSTLRASGYKVTPLLHSCKLPFLVNFAYQTLGPSLCTFFFFHTWSKLCVRFFFAGLVNVCCSIFIVIWTAPGAFSFFSILSAALVFCGGCLLWNYNSSSSSSFSLCGAYACMIDTLVYLV